MLSFCPFGTYLSTYKNLMLCQQRGTLWGKNSIVNHLQILVCTTFRVFCARLSLRYLWLSRLRQLLRQLFYLHLRWCIHRRVVVSIRILFWMDLCNAMWDYHRDMQISRRLWIPFLSALRWFSGLLLANKPLSELIFYFPLRPCSITYEPQCTFSGSLCLVLGFRWYYHLYHCRSQYHYSFLWYILFIFMFASFSSYFFDRYFSLILFRSHLEPLDVL